MIGTVGTVVDTATFGVASDVLDVVDNTVLDTVDEITGGTIDVDFDDGDLSASVGVDGVLHVGAAVGDDGIRQSSDVLDQSYDVSATKDGLDAKGQAGIDWGPLPYAEGDLTVEADGDIAAHGRVQGTLPTPIGVLSGEAEADIMREGDDVGRQPRRRREAVPPQRRRRGRRRRCRLRRHAGRLGAQRRRRGLLHVAGRRHGRRIARLRPDRDVRRRHRSTTRPAATPAATACRSKPASRAPASRRPTARRPATGTSAATCRAESPEFARAALAGADDVEASVDDMFSDLG